MIWSFAIAGTFVAALIVVDKLLAAPKYNANNSDHFDGSKFINPGNVGTHHYGDVLKWWLSGNDKGYWEKHTNGEIDQHVPKQDSNQHSITFINHATFLLQIDGLNILTDPIWSDRASPYQWIGPKRMRSPGIAFEDLPPIDTVLISHNHYDHLDIHAVKRLRENHDPQFVVPLGVEKFLQKHGVEKTIHLDWWEEAQTEQNLGLTSVPARHFSGRGLFDRNKTLWCGYVLHTSLGNIYFAGDSGYGDFFKEIGHRFGPMHTSMIPIGAYKPRWFMAPIHMSPEEAVLAHRDVQSQQSIAMHFGTFPMADDGMFEAAEDLKIARKNYEITEEQFNILPEGKAYELVPQKSADVA